MKRFFLAFFFLSFSCQYFYCQNFADKDYYLIDSLEIDKVSDADKTLIDSCLTVFHKVTHDTDKVNAISKIVEVSWDDNVWPRYNMWLYDFTQIKLKNSPSLNVAKKLSVGLASALNNIGYFQSSNGNIPEALKYYKRSLKIQEKVGDRDGVATSLNNIGSIYNRQGDVANALEYYHKSLKIYGELDNKNGMAQTLNNIGHIYHNQGDPNLALEYYHKGLKIYERLDNKRSAATLLNSIGFAYFKKENIPKALEYYNRSLDIRNEIGDKRGIATSYNNLAAAYENQLDDKATIEYYHKSLEIYKEMNHKLGLSTTLNNIGRIHFNKGELVKSKEFTNRSMVLANEIGSPDNIQRAASLLSSIYEKEGNGLKALKMHKLYITMRDSINNESTQKATIRQQAKYEYEKDKVIDDAERDKLIAVEQKEKEKQKIISFATAGGLVLVIVFLFFVFNRLKITKKQKVVIEEQTKEIVDSITYAKRIQEAILPTNEFVKNCLPESFIFYKPKDIVAGDFYWVDKKEEQILFAAADCTGHGVPGAMVSVVCHNAMDRAMREYNLITPGEILDKTREIVIEQLNKAKTIHTETVDNIRDGMDIALCALNTKTNELSYAGAYNPLWILRSNGDEIEEVKATRQSIGKVDHPRPFETHQVSLKKGDRIYIFSDGFADQFGGQNGKKMMYKPFKKLLISMKNESMENQLKTINNHFEKWKGSLEQIDDVCVMGIEI